MAQYRIKKIINIATGGAQNDNGETTLSDFSCWRYLKDCFWYKFFSFKGRARRKEYIVFQLADAAIAACFYIAVRYFSATHQVIFTAHDIISTLLIIPLLSVTVRRFHDVGLSGWWCLLGVIPFVVIPFLAIKNSEKTENKYGAVPAGKSFAEVTYLDKAADVIEFETITDKRSLKRSA